MGSRPERVNSSSDVRAKWRIERRIQTDAKLWKAGWNLKTRFPQSWRRATRKLGAISRYCLKSPVKPPVRSTAKAAVERRGFSAIQNLSVGGDPPKSSYQVV